MTRILAGVIFVPTFALLLALAGLMSVLCGLAAVIRWVSDLATPVVFKLAEIADGRPLEDQE